MLQNKGKSTVSKQLVQIPQLITKILLEKNLRKSHWIVGSYQAPDRAKSRRDFFLTQWLESKIFAKEQQKTSKIISTWMNNK